MCQVVGQVHVPWSESLQLKSVRRFGVYRKGESTYNLDFVQRLVAVVQQVFGLPAVDFHHTEKQLRTQSQRHGSLPLADDVSHIVFEIGSKHILFGEFALEVGGQPDAGQRACLGQQCVGVKHSVVASVEGNVAILLDLFPCFYKVLCGSCAQCDW